MKKKHISKPEKQRNIASERIIILFHEAKLMFKEDPKFSNKYVKLARKIAMKYKVKIPSKLKRQFCKNCLHFLVPGRNLRVRTSKGNIVYFCLDCKHHTRIGYK